MGWKEDGGVGETALKLFAGPEEGRDEGCVAVLDFGKDSGGTVDCTGGRPASVLVRGGGENADGWEPFWMERGLKMRGLPAVEVKAEGSEGRLTAPTGKAGGGE